VELLATRDVAQADVDAAQAKYDQLKAQCEAADSAKAAEEANLQVMTHELEAAKADIDRATDELQYTVITSPIDGLVTMVAAEVGELVVTGTMNNQGTVIMEVADLDTMLFKARMDENSIASVKVGQKAKVRIPAYHDRVFNGVVQTAALANTEEKDGTKYFKVEVLIQKPGQRILSGLTGDVDIETEEHKNVIAVPSQAVLGRPTDDLPSGIRDAPEVDKSRTQSPVVYRFVNGKAVVTPVKVGPSDMTHTMIESGLKEGDVVVIGPYKVLETLAHDQKLKDEKTAATQPATKPA
jgi:HlyD family secretion protein